MPRMGNYGDNMYNDCSFIGNIGNDPEVRASSGGGTFTTFSIAVNKMGADKDAKPLWVNVTCFGKTSEWAGKNLKKGNQVLVQGTLELQEYEGRDGKNHVSVKLLAGKVLSLTRSNTPATSTPMTAASTVTDEDIPF